VAWWCASWEPVANGQAGGACQYSTGATWPCPKRGWVGWVGQRAVAVGWSQARQPPCLGGHAAQWVAGVAVGGGGGCGCAARRHRRLAALNGNRGTGGNVPPAVQWHGRCRRPWSQRFPVGPWQVHGHSVCRSRQLARLGYGSTSGVRWHWVIPRTNGRLAAVACQGGTVVSGGWGGGRRRRFKRRHVR